MTRELATLTTYLAHLKTCSRCRPRRGELCVTGHSFHEAWRKEAAAQGPIVKEVTA